VGIGSASWEQLNLVYYDALINLPYDCNACSVSSFNSQANAIYATAQADPEITTLELNELQGVVSVATSSWQYWKSQSNWQPYVDDEPLIPEFAIGVDVSQDWSWGDFWGCAFTDGIMWVGSSDIVGAIMGGGAGAGVSSGATAVMPPRCVRSSLLSKGWNHATQTDVPRGGGGSGDPVRVYSFPAGPQAGHGSVKGSGPVTTASLAPESIYDRLLRRPGEAKHRLVRQAMLHAALTISPALDPTDRQGRPPESDDWRDWLTEMFPRHVRAGFAARHEEFWQHVWSIQPGEHTCPFAGIWPREGGKSTSARAGVCSARRARPAEVRGLCARSAGHSRR